MICPKCKKEPPADARFCPWCGRLLGAVPRRSTRRGNAQGTAYRRGSTWTAQWTVDVHTDSEGNYIQTRKTKGGFKTKKAAQDFCITKSLVPDRIAPKLIEYWRQYEKNRLTELSKDKQTCYRIAWKRWESLWYTQVDRITSAQLQATVNDQTSSYYPARDMKSLMVNLYKLIGADGHASKDVPSFIILPKLTETKREPFTDLEQAALWKAWENGCMEAAIPLTMIYTGMMPAEMMSLRADMIDLKARQIIGAGHKTAVRKASTIYLPDAIVPVLEKTLQNMAQNGLKQPFHRSESKFYEDYYTALSAAKTRRLTPYSCRHTTATALAVTKNIAPQTVKQIMRWSTTRMLDRYAHPDDQTVRDAANMIGKKPANSLQDDSEAL